MSRVVALGGGHGLSATLRSVAPWADHLTAVVSTADDGGSSGRLREARPRPAFGDLRRCLTALADPTAPWTRALERRFADEGLAGHPTGNLVLLALTEELGDLQAACDEVARTAGIDPQRARVVPATAEPVALHGRTADGTVVSGQVAVSETAGIAEVWVEPAAPASPLAVEAVDKADLVLLGPGSLYTSVLAAAVVGELREALAATTGRVVYVANLRSEQAEARGYDLATHVAALRHHGIEPEVVVAQPGALPRGRCRTEVVEADVAGANGLVHDPDKLGAVLRRLA